VKALNNQQNQNAIYQNYLARTTVALQSVTAREKAAQASTVNALEYKNIVVSA
jgi:hypothetical protein